jgi:hypothetical protein
MTEDAFALASLWTIEVKSDATVVKGDWILFSFQHQASAFHV